jgi:hypothetical protein
MLTQPLRKQKKTGMILSHHPHGTVLGDLTRVISQDQELELSQALKVDMSQTY